MAGKTGIGYRRGLLMLGSSSADIRARERIEIVGDVAASASPASLGTATSEEQIH